MSVSPTLATPSEHHPLPVDGSTESDGPQPDLQGRLAPVGLQPAERLQVSLLQDVPGLVTIPDLEAEEGEELLAGRVVDESPGGFVALPGSFGQVPVGLEIMWHWPLPEFPGFHSGLARKVDARPQNAYPEGEVQWAGPRRGYGAGRRSVRPGKNETARSGEPGGRNDGAPRRNRPFNLLIKRP